MAKEPMRKYKRHEFPFEHLESIVRVSGRGEPCAFLPIPHFTPQCIPASTLCTKNPVHTTLSHSSKLSDRQLGPRSHPWKLEMVSLQPKESANMLRELEDKETS